MRIIRYWDLAATKPKKGKDPDFTAGALVVLADGLWYIADMRRIRDKPKAVEELILQTAILDRQTYGPVPIRMEQEGGASGVFTIDYFQRKVLVGFDFKQRKPTKNKVDRARPLSTAAEAGNVRIVRGDWNAAFLDEIEQFPDGAHDDQVDAVSGACAELGMRWLAPRVHAPEIEMAPAVAGLDAEITAALAEITDPAERAEAERLLRKEGL